MQLMLKTLSGTYIEINMPGGVFVFRKYLAELIMACLLLMCFLFLSKEAAMVSKEMNGQTTIVVDPGHGGRDPGMIGIGNLEEKGINLSIAKKLKKKLEEKGYIVVMTREEDIGLYNNDSKNMKAQDLQNRISLIEKSNAALTVSIHQNSYQDSSVCGPQVFYYEDSVEGKRLAQTIQSSMNQMPSVSRQREAKGNKNYYLLKKSEGIVNIVECGFLTNPEEAELLQTTQYQENIAEAVAQGIFSFLEES